MELPVLTHDQAPAASRPVLDGIEADLGFVPHFAGTIAVSPLLLAAFDGLRRAVGDPSFDPVRREITGLAVGVAVDNAYGVAFHSTVLAGLGYDAGEIKLMRDGTEPTDPVHGAVYAFAQATVLERGAVDDRTVERATNAGLSPADLLQLVAECTLASLVGMVDHLAGRIELDPILRPQSWG